MGEIVLTTRLRDTEYGVSTLNDGEAALPFFLLTMDTRTTAYAPWTYCFAKQAMTCPAVPDIYFDQVVTFARAHTTFCSPSPPIALRRLWCE